ncbi:spore germination protein KC [Desulfotomaculum arcticum]|uniref:Spore germination protein KC n=1 Tax=Desulfotruncus arcticus DSM 17038 TaxID=1121424 RepID=A0A1I2NYM2_9FIRM|nr:Ger(x)C family spore germination protein [Desulfotruncus arcticus]SFG08180.1 spore germination protein KC [Desulfotomaculum arcticum] [Desulfotruncus arcticus DSM 17038]
MMKRILLPALLLFALVLSGCWDYEEYEDLIQVYALAIDFDKQSHETTLTLQYLPTTKQGKGGAQGDSRSQVGTVYSATDKTLYDALIKIEQVTLKRVFMGYLKVVIVGEDAAKYNMMDIIEFSDRVPSLRSTAQIVITSGRAEDTLSTFNASLITSSGEEISNLLTVSRAIGSAFPVSILDFTQMLAVGGIEAVAPRVITVSKKTEPEAKGGIQGNTRFVEEREGAHRVAGMAVFKGDKLAGWLNDQETLGYGWITGKKINTFKTSETSDETDTKNIFYYHVSKSRSKIKVIMEKNEPLFEVDVKIVADLRKYYSNKGSEFLSPEEVTVIENKLSESIRSDIEAALVKCQEEFKSDIFGFGFALFRKNPKLWQTEYAEKWDDVFPYTQVYINVDTKVINTGTNIRKLNLK